MAILEDYEAHIDRFLAQKLKGFLREEFPSWPDGKK
jgi:hypothetical protein